MSSPLFRLVAATVVTGALLVAIFAVTVVRFRAELRDEIHQTIIERDAAVLQPVALQQLAEREGAPADRPVGNEELLQAVLRSSQQDGMLAVAIFGADGSTLKAVPETLLFVELPVDDYRRLLHLQPISRYHRQFPFERYFTGASGNAPPSPVLEILLPLHGRDSANILGFAQYYIDARPLADELATINRRVNAQTRDTLIVGGVLIALIVTAASFGLHRAQRVIAERNARLTRANFELTLAAKTSAVGQITSHLIHGLQGHVAGLRAVVAGRGSETSAASDWQSAANYTERMRSMIEETVALLGDAGSQTTYELTGTELASIIRSRNIGTAQDKGVRLDLDGAFPGTIDSHRGSLVCLIATNLIQNGINATPHGSRVVVALVRNGTDLTLRVQDQGDGIPESIRAHLFEPGRSGRPTGSGLGLAISQLIARQIGATLVLERTGAEGTVFALAVPLAG